MNLRYMTALAILTSIGLAQAEPHYKDEAAQQITDKMVEAHGGYKEWLESPSFDFTIAMYLSAIPTTNDRTPKDNWRYYSVIVEPKTSNALINVPLENMDGWEAGLTRQYYWGKALTYDPTYRESSAALGWFHYSMINLAFLTQVDGVTLESIGNMEHAFSGKQLTGVKMTFVPKDERTHAGFVEIYIDPDTNLLAAWRYATPFPELPGNVLPPSVPASQGRALVRYAESYTNYDGFILPNAYSTLSPDGNLIGTHVVLSADFDKPFPHSELSKPDDGVYVFER